MECPICMHHCELKEGQLGRCRVRNLENGKNRCVNYGKVTALALDPIEKKPLRMFHPGMKILSAGSFGCNLSCAFCQNHEISTRGLPDVKTEDFSPESLAGFAKKLEEADNIGLAFTYNEPLVGFEFVRDTARFVREMGMKNVIVTNGSFSEGTLREVLPYTDAMNIDLKGFTEDFYRRLGGNLETVKRFIQLSAASCHVEITALIIPGENDSEREMDQMASWIASINRNIPLHITRFFPRYQMADKPPTDIGLLRFLRDTAARRLSHVFIGNC